LTAILNSPIDSTMNSRRTPRWFTACLAAPLACWAGCAAPASVAEQRTAESAAAQPQGPAADAAIAPLAFLSGTWVLEQPGGALIEESWGAPRGKAILGSFRRVLGNGATPFYEFTHIVATDEGVRLRQIHVHGNFDTDPRRAVPMVLQLEKLDDKSASFVPLADRAASHAGSLERVSYTRVDASTLLLVVEPQADENGVRPAPLEFRMTRAR